MKKPEAVTKDINTLGDVNIKAVREAGQEIEILAIALRAGHVDSECADLLVRGMTMRIQALARVVTSAIDPDCDPQWLLNEIGLEETA